MTDYISRQAAIEALKSEPIGRMIISKYNMDGWLEGLPAADVVEADKAQKEIDYWHDKAQSYEQTILKLTINAADVRDDATAHKVVGGGERDGATCWFECDCCGLAVDVGDVFCKHCGARFVP